LITAREKTITQKDEVIQNREENLEQAQISITTHERTIMQKNEVIKSRKKTSNRNHKTIREKERVIENLNTYLARQRDASHVKDSAYQDLEQRMEDQVAALRGQLEDKDDEIQALENLLEKHRLRRLSRKSEKESLGHDCPELKGPFKLKEAWYVKEEGSEDGELLVSVSRSRRSLWITSCLCCAWKGANVFSFSNILGEEI
jgi:predicted RNase H-like nuclease (RuvC/YqgF family)